MPTKLAAFASALVVLLCAGQAESQSRGPTFAPLGVTEGPDTDNGAWFFVGSAPPSASTEAYLARVPAAGAATRNGTPIGYEWFQVAYNCSDQTLKFIQTQFYDEAGRVFSMASHAALASGRSFFKVPETHGLALGMAVACGVRAAATERVTKAELISTGRRMIANR